MKNLKRAFMHGCSFVLQLGLIIFTGSARPAVITYTEAFNTDTPNVTDGSYPAFTLNAGTASVSGGVLRLDGGGGLFLQRFTRPGFSGDLTITGKVKAATFGGWTAGMEFGNRRFIFHPGHPGGAFRIEDANLAFAGILVGNTNMGFNPSVTAFHTMQLDWNSALNKVTITITDGDGIGGPFVFVWMPDAGFNSTGAIGFTSQNGGPAFFDDLTVSTPSTNQSPDCSGASIPDQSAGANCQATISAADVTGVNDPDGDNLTITVNPTTLSLGANSVTVTADDGNGGTCNTTITVNVVDNTAPVLTVSSTPITLWPPNHKYSTINISQYVTAVSDNCNNALSVSEVVIIQVTSDEPEDATGGGDGNTTNDIVITSCNTVDLRSERQGSGNGRVYTIHLQVSDGNGNSANATIQVHVPKSNNGNPAVDDGAAAGYTLTGSCGSAPKLSGNFGNPAPQAVIPKGYALEQNYPNPFNPTTTISFALPEAGEVSLSIFNMNGQLVKRLVAGEMNAGRHHLVWDATDDRGVRVASGVYLYVIKAGEFTAQRKLVLMK